jgi:pyruvate kinase
MEQTHYHYEAGSGKNTPRAKIICTLGPSSHTYEQIHALAEAGMSVARLNFSHGSYDDHRLLVETVRKVSRDSNKSIAILQDLQGPKIRVQTFEKGKVTLTNGAPFTLTVRPVTGTEQIVSVSYPAFNKDVKAGGAVLLDDGNIRLQVNSIEGEDVHCTVVNGGDLSDHKGLNLPGSVLSVDALSEKDKEDLAFGLKMNVDYIALSFVQRPEDVILIKKIITDHGKQTPDVAKIEKPQAVADIENIADVTDCIMVARGDLGVEMDIEEVPPIQKYIINLCNKRGVPVITATQMLESMITHFRPTRAEATDVANAILDGSDAVMLSGETASGKFPVEAVKTMARIVAIIEEKGGERWDLKRRRPDIVYSDSLAIGYSACHAANLVRAKAIVCLTQSGSTAQMVARFRPDCSILALTTHLDAYYRSALWWGVHGYMIDELHTNIDHAIDNIIEMLRAKGIVAPGDTLVFTAGLPFYKKRGTNMLRIETV